MIEEFDRIVLTSDLPNHNLKQGDVGTVISIYQNGRTDYDVEFMTLEGKTVAVVSLAAGQVRPIARQEIAHARLIEVA